MCLLCLFLASCISVPGEKTIEDKNLAADYYDVAIKYMDQKQYEKAITCFEKAREKTDETTKIDYQLARAYAMSNKWYQSSELFAKLLELDPDNSTIKENYAYTMYKGGNKEKALQLYAELCDKNPEDERLKNNYETLRDAANSESEEQKESEEAISSDSQN